MIGYMPMPADFKFKDLLINGPPTHKWNDPFRLHHPAMDLGHRAKIFAPFDALAGFDEAVARKEVLYEFKRELSDNDKEELDRRLGILHRLTWNSRMARENSVSVSITYYVPCMDRENISFGYRGQYVTVTGICRKVGLRTLIVDKHSIPLADIFSIESSKMFNSHNIFESWEVGTA